MEREVELSLLGSFEVRAGDRLIPIGQPKRQALLALLALRWNSLVASSEIVDVLWDADPPPNARNQIQVYVAALRKILAAEGVPDGSIQTRSSAYQLSAEMIAVDLAQFEALLGQARMRADAGDLILASHTLQQALSLWRGPALTGVTGDYFTTVSHHLEERRLIALEHLLRIRLDLGIHIGIVEDLRVAITAHPLREGLRYNLMIALYRSGRSAEALAAYREARQLTVAELGVEPGPELRQLEQLILRGEPAPTSIEALAARMVSYR